MNKHERKQYDAEYRKKNRAIILARNKRYYKKNKVKILEKNKKYIKKYLNSLSIKEINDKKEYRKEYHQKNKERIAEQRRKYRNAQFRINPQYRISHLIRNSLNQHLASISIKKYKPTINYLGCSFAEFKRYMEKQFKPGMNWGNHGKKWHLDHRIPISMFNLSNEDECQRCYNYINYQPLAIKKNRSKSNKYSEPTLLHFNEFIESVA